MDWYTEIEKRRSTILFLLLLLVIAILAVSSLRDPFALDAFWHLKTGQDWIEKGYSPFQDHYSITHYGERISSQPYLFQAGLYGFVKFFGLNTGFKFVVFLSSLFAVGLMMWWLRQIRAPTLVICLIVPMLVALLQQRAMVRPELFSYSLMIFSLILYEKACVGQATKVFPLIFLTMLFWTNYHSALLGYVIFFGLFVDLGLKHIRDRASSSTWLAWFGWGLLIVLAGFLNQGLAHPALSMFSFSGEWTSLIDEYRASLKGSVGIVTLGLIPLSLLTLTLLLYQRRFGYLLVCAIFSWAAISMTRMVTPSGIVILCLFALTFSRIDIQSLLTKGPTLGRTLFTFSVLSVFLATMTVCVLMAQQLVRSNQFLLGNFPDQLVQYMRANNKSGNIFNDYNIGGYLVYQLGDQNRVYIDGRTHILYPLEHMAQWQEAMKSSAVLKSEIEKHQIDYVILRHRQDLIGLVSQTGMMQLDYSDFRFSLYSREDANFPISGALWSKPWCWNENMGVGLNSETSKAFELLPKYSPLTHLVNLANDFYSATDRRNFLLSVYTNDNVVWHEGNLRFTGYRALELGLNEQAIHWFYSVRQKLLLKDFLAGALANLRAGRFDQAEDILFNAIRVQWTSVKFNDARILQGLLVELMAKRPLKMIDSDYFDEITTSLGDYVLPVSNRPVSVADFCQTATSR